MRMRGSGIRTGRRRRRLGRPDRGRGLGPRARASASSLLLPLDLHLEPERREHLGRHVLRAHPGRQVLARDPPGELTRVEPLALHTRRAAQLHRLAAPGVGIVIVRWWLGAAVLERAAIHRTHLAGERLGGKAARGLEPPPLVLGRGHPAEQAPLGPGELAARERRVELRQRSQGRVHVGQLLELARGAARALRGIIGRAGIAQPLPGARREEPAGDRRHHPPQRRLRAQQRHELRVRVAAELARRRPRAGSPRLRQLSRPRLRPSSGRRPGAARAEWRASERGCRGSVHAEPCGTGAGQRSKHDPPV